ncbi:excinuclease ABC subunit UvrA [Weeksella virosa]|uniref:UvrABC system protein A n=1 Tax=Weeksella virosa (strain ATCC 43766 / DSM 16922 / JCM 21250 / CCUG 30538 / CDC 9751 / IAM 14551 / NBRC 16016 / NCTC 11634 / CL345/78) TaxID=865938 RepID=F0NYK3_WEEVC|nr:excinuclease ABC subunit UvrA [Weeksella virosa]ADX67123.1 excinuclease ABC, A subunit [Weeksella virosa DSM 16922]VEH63140.1 Excinuclease ABC subunit A [Weeksella virosa]
MSQEFIEVYGAREHNLKNIDVKIPRNELVVITGLSGSGKSSLAFDTIYAEGQRRYIETFNAYARQFLGGLERPDVDKIEGLSPVIAIEQKTTSKNPRSTVGTITEIYDYLRLLYARVATPFSSETNEPMVAYTEDQIIDLVRQEYHERKIALMTPLVKYRKGHYRELFVLLAKKGFDKVRVDGEIRDIEPGMMLDRYKAHDVELIIDRLILKDSITDERLRSSILQAFQQGDGVMMVYDYESGGTKFFSKNLMCPTTGLSYDLPEPNTFSFNSPKGACTTCAGLGELKEPNFDLIFDDPKKSLKDNLAPVFEVLKNTTRLKKQLEGIFVKHNVDEKTPYGKLPQAFLDDLKNGVNETLDVQLKFADVKKVYKLDFEGLESFFQTIISDKTHPSNHTFTKRFSRKVTCPTCHGTRLQPESLQFRIDNKNIAEVASLDLSALATWIEQVPKILDKTTNIIAQEILKEIATRLQFLLDVGLDYLSLNRPSGTLSGGEAQRIRLATQIGSQLVNVLYILDEPSIGLHQRDNVRLIESLKKLRDIGNSVLVVEHDKDMILESDYVIEVGPKAGRKGGEIVWLGSPTEMMKTHTLTAEYLNGEERIEIPKKRREGNGLELVLNGATGNNLKNVDVRIPLGKLVVVTGVSGSGKSTLINETLYRILNHHFFRAEKEPMPYKKIEGLEHLDKVIDVDQSPIGRTPRSNPATYTGIFTDIRNLFANLPESKIRGYKPGRFSFNVKGGRCETCQGAGMRVIEMNFLPDIHVKCETCHGKRFNRETLEVRYKGKSIADVLDMTVNEAVEFFEPIPKIYQYTKMLQDVGLGYITLGQQSTTLSGGEAQRVKLATELAKKQTGKTLYILDEPTTGLHFEDIKVLMQVIDQIVNLGNTVIIIEHNLDVIKLADYIIDVGPEGGRNGGKIIATGTPEEIVKQKKSVTGKFLQNEL